MSWKGIQKIEGATSFFDSENENICLLDSKICMQFVIDRRHWNPIPRAHINRIVYLFDWGTGAKLLGKQLSWP